jgi:hypothetical protein
MALDACGDVICEDFLEKLSDYQLLKKDWVPWSTVRGRAV